MGSDLDFQYGVEARTENRDLTPLEGRPDCEAELEEALRLQAVVQDARALRVPREDEAERHVQHGHEEANLDAGRGLEVLPVEALPRNHPRRDRPAVRDE